MSLSRIVSFACRLGMIAALCTWVAGFGMPQVMAAEELQREIVPGLDLWTEERKAAPYWDMKAATPDLLSRARRPLVIAGGSDPTYFRVNVNVDGRVGHNDSESYCLSKPEICAQRYLCSTMR